MNVTGMRERCCSVILQLLAINYCQAPFILDLISGEFGTLLVLLDCLVERTPNRHQACVICWNCRHFQCMTSYVNAVEKFHVSCVVHANTCAAVLCIFCHSLHIYICQYSFTQRQSLREICYYTCLYDS